jgi:hypothetical protein
MTSKKKSNAGRPPRSQAKERIIYTIKVTPEENAFVQELAKKFAGNVNKLFRVKILGEKE